MCKKSCPLYWHRVRSRQKRVIELKCNEFTLLISHYCIDREDVIFFLFEKWSCDFVGPIEFIWLFVNNFCQLVFITLIDITFRRRCVSTSYAKTTLCGVAINYPS